MLLYVGLGGLLGTLARFGLQGWLQTAAGGEGRVPIGTLGVNILGSLVLGFLMRYSTASALGLTIEPAADHFVKIGKNRLNRILGFSTISTDKILRITLERARVILYRSAGDSRTPNHFAPTVL